MLEPILERAGDVDSWWSEESQNEEQAMKDKSGKAFRLRDGLTGRFISPKRAKRLSPKRVTKERAGK